MKHHRYEKHGRTFSHADEGKPGTFTWRSKIGETNVDVNGDGKTFAPYVLDGEELRHGHNRCVFRDGCQEIGRDGKFSESRIFVQREITPGEWATINHGKPTKIHADDNGKCRTTLAFPDMERGEFSVEILAGGSDKQRYGFRFRHPEAGTFRLEWTFGVPEDDDVSNVENGVKIGGRVLRWSRNEAPRRSVTIDPPKGNRKTVRVILGPFTLAANEWLVVSPDTWGTDVGIAAGTDDGWATGPDLYNTFNNTGTTLLVGNASADSYYAAYLRWTGLSSIPMGATINTALLDTYISEWYAGGIGTLYAWDVDEAGVPAQDPAGSRVYNVTRTTANVAWSPTGTGWYTLSSSGFVGVIQEIFTSYATDSMTLLIIGAVGTAFYSAIEAYENAGTNEPELTITYTPAVVAIAPTGIATAEAHGTGKMRGTIQSEV